MVYIHIHTCMYVCMHACTHACVCVCMCVYVYTHIQVGPAAGEALPLLRARFGLSSVEDLSALKPAQLKETLTVDLGVFVCVCVFMDACIRMYA